MTTVEILEDALVRLSDGGWTTGMYFGLRDKGVGGELLPCDQHAMEGADCFCAAGALRAANPDSLVNNNDETTGRAETGILPYGAVEAVHRALVEADVEAPFRYTPRSSDLMILEEEIIGWNDNEATEDEVLAVFKRAIEIAKEEA